MNSTLGGDTAGSAAAPGLDTSRPHPARIYDYYLGGKNHFAADREVADKILRVWPGIPPEVNCYGAVARKPSA